MFEPPEDTEQEDPTLPPGTIAVDLRDADDKPVAGETVDARDPRSTRSPRATAASTSRRRPTTPGASSFSGLETASNIAYRVSVGYQGGAFAATPFQLQQAKAMHVVLHVYPVTHDIAAGAHRVRGDGRRRDAGRPHPDRRGAHDLQPRAHGVAAGRRAHGAARGFTAFTAQAVDERPGRRRRRTARRSSAARSPRAGTRSSSAGSSPGRATRTSTSTSGCRRTSPSRA